MKILILFYSTYGHILKMAEAASERVKERKRNGMIVVGLPYTFQGQTGIDEVTGGSPYGATTIAGSDNKRMPGRNELSAAGFQGNHVAKIASRLAQ